MTENELKDFHEGVMYMGIICLEVINALDFTEENLDYTFNRVAKKLEDSGKDSANILGAYKALSNVRKESLFELNLNEILEQNNIKREK